MRYRFAIRLIIAFAATCCLAAVGCSKGGSVSGTWKGRITLPSTGKSLSDLEFTLTQKGNDVTGIMFFSKPGAKLPLTGTVVDGKVSMSSPVKNGLGISIVGVLERRDKIRGEAVLNYDTPQLGKRQDKTTVELTR